MVLSIIAQTLVFSWSTTWLSRLLRVRRNFPRRTLVVIQKVLCRCISLYLFLSLSVYILVEHNTADISSATEGFAEGINRASEGGRQERRNSSDPGGLECLVNMYSVIDVSLSDESPRRIPHVIRTRSTFAGCARRDLQSTVHIWEISIYARTRVLFKSEVVHCAMWFE